MQTLPENIEQHLFGEYTMERIGSDNLSDVAVLHHAVYGTHVANGYYYKKYNTAYTGIINTGFIAYNRSRVAIAYYGVVPCFLQCGNAVILAAQSTDTMTHPEYRKKGLLTELHQLVLNLSIKEGVKILFGFGNQDSIPIYKHKYHWEENGIMDRFEISVDGTNAIRSLRSVPVLKYIFSGYQKAVLNGCLLSDPGLSGKDAQNGYCGVLRNAAYMAHKKYNDTMVVSIGKSKIWLKLTKDMMIGDVELNGDKLDEVLLGIKKLAKRLGIEKIHFSASRNSFLHGLFSKYYTPIPAFPVLFKNLGSGVDLNNIKFTFADIDIF